MKTNTLLSGQRICFLGAGAIAEAMIKGLLHDDQVNARATADQLYVVNKQNEGRLRQLQEQYSVQVSAEQSVKDQYLQQADVIVLAMKPNDIIAALHALSPLLNEQQLIISVVAGVAIAAIREQINLSLPIVRAMPNTASSIGLGATGISYSEEVEPHHRLVAEHIFQAIGTVAVVDEALMNIVTGVSGSGPAYIYYMMEAMIEAGIAGGLSAEQAQQLTVQTVLGAAQMMISTKEQPAALRQKVTSPGGTTQAALDTLQHHQFADIVKKAVHRAAERAEQLGAAFLSDK